MGRGQQGRNPARWPVAQFSPTLARSGSSTRDSPVGVPSSLSRGMRSRAGAPAPAIRRGPSEAATCGERRAVGLLQAALLHTPSPPSLLHGVGWPVEWPTRVDQLRRRHDDQERGDPGPGAPSGIAVPFSSAALLADGEGELTRRVAPQRRSGEAPADRDLARLVPLREIDKLMSPPWPVDSRISVTGWAVKRLATNPPSSDPAKPSSAVIARFMLASRHDAAAKRSTSSSRA
jgi:hypothetical protein